MFILTKKPDSIESGAFASCDDEGETIVQFFVDKDDAVTYNTHLEALDEKLYVTETAMDDADKMCALLGFAYTVVEPGEFVIPRLETVQNDLL
jgi:hypothetical protein